MDILKRSNQVFSLTTYFYGFKEIYNIYEYEYELVYRKCCSLT